MSTPSSLISGTSTEKKETNLLHPWPFCLFNKFGIITYGANIVPRVVLYVETKLNVPTWVLEELALNWRNSVNPLVN